MSKRSKGVPRGAAPGAARPQSGAATKGMAKIPGGEFLMGSDKHYPEEAPAHRVAVGAFWMDEHTVTNKEFRRFVDDTGYVTLAEKPANPDDYPGAQPEMLAPSSVMFRRASQPVEAPPRCCWWSTRLCRSNRSAT